MQAAEQGTWFDTCPGRAANKSGVPAFFPTGPRSRAFSRHLPPGSEPPDMNDDGHGRRVFDGVLSHVAGAGKIYANHSFSMPGRTATQHEDRLYPENWFPFGNAATSDPFSGNTGSILKGQPTDPLMIQVNTSTEYWQKGASLVHTDPAGRQDAEPPSTARVYECDARLTDLE